MHGQRPLQLFVYADFDSVPSDRRGSLAAWYVWAREDVLSGSLRTLPEYLGEQGFKTLGIVENSHLSSEYGFGRGYQYYHEVFRPGTDSFKAKEAAKRNGPEAFADHFWITYVDPMLAEERDQPWFTYVHLLDPHAPYEPIEPFRERYVPEDCGGVSSDPKVLGMIVDGSLVPDDHLLRCLRGQYTGEIAFMDQVLSRLLEKLDTSGLEQDTLVIFTSDHGEEFFEHGGMHHWLTLYEESVHVPLLFRFPDKAYSGTRISTPVSLEGLAPTIVNLLGLASFAPADGTAFDDVMCGGSQRKEVLFGAVKPYRGPDLRLLVRDGSWKLIQSLTGADKSYQLFNLEEDPQEQENLWLSHPEEGQVLLKALEDRLRDVGRSGTHGPGEIGDADVDAGTLESLKALGYL